MLQVRLLADQDAPKVPVVEEITDDTGQVHKITRLLPPPLMITGEDGVARRAVVIESVDERPDGTGDLPARWVERGRNEGWISLENPRLVVRPGGPAHDPTLGAIVLGGEGGEVRRANHTFTHADAIVVHTVDGPVRFEVLRQPDKYVAGGADDDPVTDEIYASGETQVDAFYRVRRA